MGKKLNFTDCMGFCIGQIVGSGVFVLTGVVMGLTGHGMPYAFLLAAIISLTQLIPMAILGSSLPATGGSSGGGPSVRIYGWRDGGLPYGAWNRHW